MLDHANDNQTLEDVSKLEPCRMQGLDTLSTTTWHLQLEIDSCALARCAAHIDKPSLHA